MNNAETPTSIRDVEDGTLDLCSGESYRLVPGLNHITPVGFGRAPKGTVVSQDEPRFGRMFVKQHILLWFGNLTDVKWHFIQFNLKIVMFTF